MWTEVRAFSRQPPGTEGWARLTERVTSDCPSARPGSLRKPRGRLGRNGPGKPCASNEVGITASRAPNSEGTLSRSSLNLGRLETPKSKTSSVAAELPPPAHPRPLPPTSLPAQARRGPVQRAGEEATGKEVRVPSFRPRERDRPFLPGGKQPLRDAGRRAPACTRGKGRTTVGPPRRGAQSAGAGRGRYLGRSTERWSWGTGSRCPPAARASG